MTLRKVTLIGIFLFTATLSALLSGCSSAEDPWKGTDKPRVVASFPPIYCFAKNVGGDHIALRCLCTTRGPHDYEYNPKDTLQLKTANLLLSNGQGMDDHFVDRFGANSNNHKLRVAKLGDHPGIKLKKMEAHVHHEGEAHHHHGDNDPHLWLGIDEAILMVEGIRDELKTIDPPHAADYDTNAKNYINRLKELHKEGRAKLAPKKLTIITFHESLTYFGRSFDIKIGGTIQFKPGVDLSQQDLPKLVKTCKEENAYIITTEPQYPPRTAESLRTLLKKDGVDAVLVPVDPLETIESGDFNDISATWYEDKMRQNINELVKAAR